MFKLNHQFHPKYRPDIDGLRAIAVLLVVGYHAFPERIPGGFIGVDIFFVISGYLITVIIVGNLEINHFSFSNFYSNRIRRIFPSLILVLLVGYLIGWITLLASEFSDLGWHIAGGSAFISNWQQIYENGYFDASVEQKPLLHLWSLSIEEQFYIFWPLLLWLAKKYKINLFFMTGLLLLLSFGVNIYFSKIDLVFDFYSPFTRFWELLSGAFLAIYLRSKNIQKIILSKNQSILNNLQNTAGYLFLAIGLYSITKTSIFPGWWAVLPVIATIMIISAGHEAWLNKRFLSSRPLVWLGLISYPLYLWHWLLISYLHILDFERPSRIERISAVIFAFMLAILTYLFIERPLRFGDKKKIKAILLIAAMIIVGICGCITNIFNGLEFRSIVKKYHGIADSHLRYKAPQSCFHAQYGYLKEDGWYCDIGNQNIKPSIFITGDSHLLNLMPAFELYSRAENIRMQFSGRAGCPPLLGLDVFESKADHEKFNCQLLNEKIFDYIKEHEIKKIILVGYWTYYTFGTTNPDRRVYVTTDLDLSPNQELTRKTFQHALDETVSRYEKIGVKVYLVQDTPLQAVNGYRAALGNRIFMNDVDDQSISIEEHRRNQEWVRRQFALLQQKWPRLDIIDLDEGYCNDRDCPLLSNEKLVYFDPDHLTVYGGTLAYPPLRKQMQ